MIINIPITRLPLVVPIPNSFEYNIAKIPVKAYRVSSATSGFTHQFLGLMISFIFAVTSVVGRFCCADYSCSDLVWITIG